MTSTLHRTSAGAAVVLRAARRHVWVFECDEKGTRPARRLRVLGGVDLAPGDLVDLDEKGAVRSRQDRRSVLRRNTGRGEQVLAANIDDLMVLCAAGMVEGKEGLIARCIAAARKEGIDVALVFNKIDIDDDGQLRAEARSWAGLGFDVHSVSALCGHGLDRLQQRLRGRWAALVGPSGVGKSTLINSLAPGNALRTGELGAHGRGRHTTSLGQAIPWAGGFLIDLPGVRSFGLFDETSLDAAFPEIMAASKDCRFADCVHGPEPGCAVKAAVEKNEIDKERLASWHRVRESIRKGREGMTRPSTHGRE